ncbi:DUF1266 domain-containing protein [Flavobacterium jejuense]|uniref:DUF1266 domain-containing protein n=2 Tax=Flavobacterium jejuense TaxID=1544455 RepID=A0ABX0IS50_9FLAO|nr:DUF1266 domain-containing protein [Flavobacterium jejuense]
MNTLKKMKIVLVVLLPFLILQSCGSSSSEKIEDEQLSSFMLGGIYFFNGYGGTNAVADMMIDAGYTTDKELVGGYKEILEFPFETSQASGIKSVFKSMWNISNKEQLLESINDLKTREHTYKAWDYARIVNNANMGYACGFLTKEEVKKITLEILPLARKKFKNWDDYFTDFNKGRIDWNSEDKDSETYEKIANTITKYDHSIYKILPLNTDKE